MTLYEISNTYKSFLDAVESGEIPEEAVADTLEGIQGDFYDKADNIACMVKNLSADVVAMKAERDALSERIKSKQSKADSLKHYLSESMKTLDIPKIETSRNAISFRKSTSCFIADEEDFKQKHTDLCKKEIVVSIPKADIIKLLKDGQEISGAELKVSQNLQIK